jgi:hypothetical protein
LTCRRSEPESLAMCLGTHQIGGAVSDDWFRRRDADGWSLALTR